MYRFYRLGQPRVSDGTSLNKEHCRYKMQTILDRFLQHLSANGASPTATLNAYRTDLSQCVAFLADHGINDVQALQPDDLQAFCAWLQERGYAKATIARRIVALRALCAFLVQAGILATDPSAALPLPVVARTVRPTLGPNQIAALRAVMCRDSSAEAWRDRAILEVLLATALRASTLVALDVGDVALEQAMITICGRRGTTRAVALLPTAVMALLAYIQLGRPKLARTNDHESALFLNQQGARLTRQGCWVVLKGYARQLGLDDLSPELIRQSVAAQRFVDGATVDEVQALLGHAVRKTTAVYQPIAPTRE